jgi:hypothetical protein
MRLILVLALLGSAQDAVKNADKNLKQAVKEQNRKALDGAVVELITANNAEAMKSILGAAAGGAPSDKAKEPKDDAWWMDAYFTLLNGAASFTEAGALNELADFILKAKGKIVARDLMSQVANHGQKQLIPVCLRILEAAETELKIMAADHLVAIGDKSIVEPLIKALKVNEKEQGDLRFRIGRALTVLTGQDYGDNVSNWQAWWEQNKDKAWDVPAGSGGGTGTVTDGLDRSRQSEWEKLKKTGKVLILEAGTGCKCGKPHDFDNIDKVSEKMGLKTERITKAELEAKIDFNLHDYVAVLANCTMIREHCVCPQCKPGDYAKDRLHS